MSKNNWRTDIEGLRGLAIISVIINHYDSSILPGGFLGVDIFFVLSGYLISKQIFTNNYFVSLAGVSSFMKRRFLRILPSLLTCVILFTFLFTFFLAPKIHSSYFQTSFLSIFGLSNVLISLSGFDYFAPTSNYNPFLHLWSISLEDQFYFFFILLSFILRRVEKNKLFILIFFISFVSFLLSIKFSIFTNPIAFYNIPFRFWEFGLGALVYFLFSSINTSYKYIRAIKLLSLSFLCTTIIFIPEDQQSIITLLFVVLSTCILIIPATESKYKLDKILSSNFLRTTGQYSYSLYLFHFPTLKLLEYYFDLSTEFNLLIFAFYAFTTSLLAYCNYTFIEKKFIDTYRNNSEDKNSLLRSLKLLRWWVISSALLIIFLKAINEKVSFTIPYLRHLQYKGYLLSKVSKLELESNRNFFILGDSHAQMFIPMLQEVALEKKYSLIDKTGSGCLIGYNVQYLDAKGIIKNSCTSLLNNFFDSIMPKNKNSYIFMGNRINAYVQNRLISKEDKPVKGIFINNKLITNSATQLIDAYFSHLNSIIKIASKYNIKIYYLAPIPENKVSTFKCIYNPCKEECHTSLTEQENYRHLVMLKLKNLQSENKNFYVWDLFKKIVQGEKITHFYKDKVIYRDDDHLTDSFCLTLKKDFLNYTNGK